MAAAEKQAVTGAGPFNGLLTWIDQRFLLLHLRVSAHVPRDALRLVPQAARASLDLRHAHIPVPDGRGLLRLPPSLGPDVLLGCTGDREPLRRDSRDRTGSCDLD